MALIETFAVKDCYSRTYKYTREENPEKFPTGFALTDTRESSYRSVVESEQRQALQGIAQKGIIVGIDIFVFFIHWRLARRSRQTAS